MKLVLLTHEWLVIGLGLALLVADLWLAPTTQRRLGCVAAAGIGLILVYSMFALHLDPNNVQYAFGKMYVLDGLALFFKRFFLLTAMIVLLMSVAFADRIQTGIVEYYTLLLFALAGMLFASSANDFSLLFVSLELITVSFYVLTSFQRARLTSLEAGVKYLIIGALCPSFTVFGGGFEGGRLCFVAARALHRSSTDHRPMVSSAHHHLRRHHSLRQSLRHPAAQPEAAAGLFEHRPRRLHAAGHRSADQ